MDLGAIAASLPVVLHWAIVVGLAIRIMMKRRETGVALAWLVVVATVPLGGALVYLLVGETWMAPARRRRARALLSQSHSRITLLRERAQAVREAGSFDRFDLALSTYADRALNAPVLTGNRIDIVDGAEPFFARLIEDIDNAKETVRLMFYIWWPGGIVEEVTAALGRAAARGVKCIALIDAAGSRTFFRAGGRPALECLGIDVVPLLPVGIIRALFARIDLRNHRKIATIDRRIAYCGSMNMADPALFKADGGYGRWVDVMARVEGPAAEALDITLCLDWALDATGPTASLIMDAPGSVELPGEVAAQVVSSGPGQSPRGTLDTLLTMIFAARNELIITTPYFIPNEPMLAALICAARRGVKMRLVLPELVDSRLVRLASRAYYDDLLNEGVEIHLYRGGLLHAKTVTVDGRAGLIGSANMDRRSFGVNFETSLFIYTDSVVADIRALQLKYIESARPVDKKAWLARPFHSRLVENAIQVFAPIL